MIKRFIDEYKTKYNKETLSYRAGVICQDGDITNQQSGAEDTFAIGMPVYDIEGNELGKLSIGLFKNLSYSADIEIPVYTWRVDGYKCDVRKTIKTYYQNEFEIQNKIREAKEEQSPEVKRGGKSED